jgi:hypothetical protein
MQPCTPDIADDDACGERDREAVDLDPVGDLESCAVPMCSLRTRDDHIEAGLLDSEALGPHAGLRARIRSR